MKVKDIIEILSWYNQDYYVEVRTGDEQRDINDIIVDKRRIVIIQEKDLDE